MASAWVDDKAVSACQCGQVFGPTKRKHHCRHCGNIFCKACSSEKCMLPDSAGGVRDPVRVCKSCAAELQPYQQQYAEDGANCTKTNHLADSRTLLPASVKPHANSPFTMTLGSAIRNAAFSLQAQLDPLLVHDQRIPEKILANAQGFMFMTFLRVGFLGGARMGTGLAIVKRDDGLWGAPSAVGMGGLSAGFMVGVDSVNLTLVFTHRKICSVLASQGQLSLGAEGGLTFGPVGRNASASVNAGDKGLAPVYAYSPTRGFFAGVDVSGEVIVTRKSVNHRFYGVKHDPYHILFGDVPRPAAAQPLYEALSKACSGPEDEMRDR